MAQARSCGLSSSNRSWPIAELRGAAHRPRTPQSNEIAERVIKQLMQAARSQMVRSGRGEEHCFFALADAAFKSSASPTDTSAGRRRARDGRVSPSTTIIHVFGDLSVSCSSDLIRNGASWRRKTGHCAGMCSYARKQAGQVGKRNLPT